MKEFALFAEELADCAGNIIRAAFGKNPDICNKSDNTLVTATDRAVEMSLREMIAKRFPDHGIYGEEYAAVNENSSWQWVIDPIDGTNSFIAGMPIFTTLIALCKDGIPLIGIIDQPILRERLRGISESETRNQKAKTEINNYILATSSTDYFTAEESSAFALIRKNAAATIRHGDAYLYAKLAGAEIDLVIDSGLKPYDFCAVAAVIKAHGAIITDWEGRELTIKSSGRVIAASDKTLHQQALQLLSCE